VDAMTTTQQLDTLFSNMVEAIETRQKVAVERVAANTKKHLERELSAASGGNMALSGFSRTTGGRRKVAGPLQPGVGKKIGVGYKTFPDGRGALISGRGPIPLVEHDIPKHVVVSRHARGAGFTRTNAKGKQVKGRNSIGSRNASVLFGLGAAGGGRRAVLHWGGNIFARYTFASSKGRQPWAKGSRAAGGEVARIFQQSEMEILENVLGR